MSILGGGAGSGSSSSTSSPSGATGGQQSSGPVSFGNLSEGNGITTVIVIGAVAAAAIVGAVLMVRNSNKK